MVKEPIHHLQGHVASMTKWSTVAQHCLQEMKLRRFKIKAYQTYRWTKFLRWIQSQLTWYNFLYKTYLLFNKFIWAEPSSLGADKSKLVTHQCHTAMISFKGQTRLDFQSGKCTNYKPSIYLRSQTYNKDEARCPRSSRCLLQHSVFSILHFYMNYSWQQK